MARLCTDCHHYPSERAADYGAHCQCRCHDIADASPKILAALKRAVPWLGRMIADGGHLETVAPNDAIGALAQAEAAIAEAESPEGITPEQKQGAD